MGLGKRRTGIQASYRTQSWAVTSAPLVCDFAIHCRPASRRDIGGRTGSAVGPACGLALLRRSRNLLLGASIREDSGHTPDCGVPNAVLDWDPSIFRAC